MEREMVVGAAEVVSSTADLASLLRRLRRRQARTRRAPMLSYRELATRTGWSHSIIGAYLTGKVLPPVDRFDELVRQLDAAPAELGALATARDRIGDLPPVRSGPGVPPRQLPAGVAVFAGRTAALAVLDNHLGRGPVVISSVGGGAGVGKPNPGI